MLAKGSPRSSAHQHDELIRQVADSEAFRAAPTMRALLLYLWEHQGEPVSEYAIATEALGRSPDFDPKLDSTVRVQIARLRTRLKEFYEAGGDAFPLRLSLPLGRHELHWDYRPPQKPRGPLVNLLVSFLVNLACIAEAVFVGCRPDGGGTGGFARGSPRPEPELESVPAGSGRSGAEVLAVVSDGWQTDCHCGSEPPLPLLALTPGLRQGQIGRASCRE